MEFTDSTHGNPEPTRSALVIDLNEVPSSSSSEILSPDAFSVVRSFHDDLTPPAGAPAELPGVAYGSACGSCGLPEVRGYVLVCDGCERGFHLGCVGIREQQTVMLEEWMCGECVRNAVSCNRWPLGAKTKASGRKRRGGELLDINALPSSDGEGEDGDLPDSRKQTPGGNPFGVPITHSNFLHVANGFGFQNASDVVRHSFKLGFEDIFHHKQTARRIFEEVDLLSLSEGLRNSNHTGIRLPPQNLGMMHLQALREYILERHGVLEEGWRVEFKQSMSSGELHAVYCAPDGKIFESMFEVACHLGLMSNSSTIGAGIRSYGSASPQRRLQLPTRRRHSRLAGVNGVAESKETLTRGFCKEQSSDIQTLGCAGKFGNCVEVTDAWPEETGGSKSQQLNDGLPVQYEDFFVLSMGKIDVRPSYHNVNQISPVGYRSCWHDKVTGSLFMCDVSDGGDSGPVFRVRRCSCSVLRIPDGSTVLCRPNLGQSGRQHEEKSDDMTSTNMGCDEDFSILMILSEPSPPREHDILSCLGASSNECFNVQTSNLQHEASSLCQSSGNIFSGDLVLRDEIGEFSVEESSSSLAWRTASKKLVDVCREIAMQAGTLKFFCKHVADGTCSTYRDITHDNNKDIFISLAKFCGSSDFVNIPSVIRGDSELETFSEVLMKWLDKDRFGLDVEFVQEIVEQLPGAQACLRYVLLNERSSYSSSLTVGNGHLQVKIKDGVEGKDEETLDGLFEGGKRARTQMVEDALTDNHLLPPGKPISSRLPSQLVGDVLQVWGFLWRFYEVLSLKEPLSFEELEKELISPWFDGLDVLEKFGRESLESEDTTSRKTEGKSGYFLSSSIESCPAVSVENPHAFIPMETGAVKEAAQARWASVTYSRCTGFALTKAHNSLLRVLICELQSKVAAVVDPNFETGESKSKRGRKKDTDFWTAAKRTKLSMLPFNELTWPELVRRYILAVLSMDGKLDSAEITIRESAKVFRCLQGDGGVLCGSLTGVAGIEADALLLAEATKKIFGSLNREIDILSIDDEESDGISSCERIMVNEGNIPEWAKVLEPVRKLPTNVGARIRNCVKDALEKDPPEWAKTILEHSISKGVYKGNASGPTKKAVLSVLADVCTEGLQLKPDRERKRKKFVSISDIIMKQCRIVLRRAAAADDAKVFCNLLGRKLINCSDNDDEGILGTPAMVSRPLDFRTIDLRLVVGSYGGSHEAFLEDVRELWTNVRIAYGDQPELVQLAETLSQNFESLYKKQVITLFQRLVEFTKSECISAESKKEIEEILVSANEIPKAPWEEGVCKVCGIDKDDDSVLLCDTCDAEYHTYCLNPPLARIPEGNWYCPSCVFGKRMVQDASESVQGILPHRKKYRGEVTRVYLDSLEQLAAVIEEREYWELSVQERTFLLKFLCDELLNSALIRQHLEQCAEASTDLLQKLRSLSVEWKTLKYKEESLTAKVAKVERSSLKSVGDVGTEKGSAAALTNNNKFIGELNTMSDRHNDIDAFSGDLPQLEGGQNSAGPNFFKEHPSATNSEKNYGNNQIIEPNGAEYRSKSVQAAVGDSQSAGNSLARMAFSESDESFRWKELLASNLPQQEINDLGSENIAQGNKEKDMGSDIPTVSSSEDLQGICVPLDTGIIHIGEHALSTDVNKSQSESLELKSIRNEILLLQNSITGIETQLLKQSVRREFLGSDSVGRLYWILAASGTLPRLIVHGNLELDKRGKMLCHNSFPEENCSVLGTSALYGIDTLWTPGGSNASFPFVHEHSDGNPICSTWVSYQSETEIKDLICCLKDNDPRERELKDSILNWQKLRFQGSHQTENRDWEEPQITYSRSSSGGTSISYSSLLTKATSLLETRYGPCFEPEMTGFLKKQGRKKAKVTIEKKMYRCECLEPIWPSRHHCFSCHRTFFTDVELEGHNDGKCNIIPPASEKSKENSDTLKGKDTTKSETARVECTGAMDIVDASKSGCSEFSSRLIRYQNDGLVCPFDFEDICSKFIIKDSNKELVKEIGLIGSNGIPSFVSSVSPYLSDPTLMLGPIQEDNCVQGDKPKADEQLAFSQGNKMTNIAAHDVNFYDNSSRCDVKEDGGSKITVKPVFECLEQKDRISSLHNCASGMEIGNCCVVPEHSLRPLIGKASHILRRLKINLLDMDAALPKEALRPSKANLEKRWAWRAFVKSAETIHEMVQAIILFEDMIKAEYLKNRWWYWSSLSAAAKISTLSSLALRIYSLDAAIEYEKLSSDLDSLEPSNLLDQNQQPSSDPPEKYKLCRKPNKKRKEPES